MVSIIKKTGVLLTGLVLASMSSLASAGSIVIIVGSPSSVPAMDGALLIVLGLLLAVIAARYLSVSEGARKLMSVLVLGGGLTMAGMGVDDALATGKEISPDSPACNGGTEEIDSNQNDSDQNVELTSRCSSAVEVLGYNAPCGSSIIHQDAPPGTTINPNQTVKYSYCPPI